MLSCSLDDQFSHMSVKRIMTHFMGQVSYSFVYNWMWLVLWEQCSKCKIYVQPRAMVIFFPQCCVSELIFAFLVSSVNLYLAVNHNPGSVWHICVKASHRECKSHDHKQRNDLNEGWPLLKDSRLHDWHHPTM